MYVDIVPNRNSPPVVLLREGWREGNRVRKRTLANLSSWPPAKVETLRKLLRNEPLVSLNDAFSIVRFLLHGHVELVLNACRKLHIPSLLDRRPSRHRSCVLAMLSQRLLCTEPHYFGSRALFFLELRYALDSGDHNM